VSDIHAVLLLVADAADELEARGGSAVQQLNQLIKRAEQDLEAIIEPLTKRIIIESQDGHHESPDISKIGWLKYDSKIKTMMVQLRETRENITAVLSAHTA